MNDDRASVSLFLPTYRRSGPLVWSLASALVQRFDGLDIRKARLIIINNDLQTTPVDEAVRQAIAKVGTGIWDVQVIHRKKPMYPIFSWYEGMREFSSPGDILFLLGDDDLLLPESLATRTAIFLKSEVDFLLTTSLGGLIFKLHDDGDIPRAIFFGESAELKPSLAKNPDSLCAEHIQTLTSAFIGTHAYRNTDRFWDAYKVTYDRLNAIPIDDEDKFAMFPLFLSLQFLVQGNGLGLQSVSCLRGQSETELVGGRFGKIAWQKPGFYYATTAYVLEKSDLKNRSDLAPLRKIYRQLVMQWLPLSLGISQFREVARHLKVFGGLLTAKGLSQLNRGMLDFIKSVLRINALRLRRHSARETGKAFEEIFSRL